MWCWLPGASKLTGTFEPTTTDEGTRAGEGKTRRCSRNWPLAMGGDGWAAASHQATAVIPGVLKESSRLLSENVIVSPVVLGS